MAVHGTVVVGYARVAEMLGLVRSASRNVTDDPELAASRLHELERVLDDLMAQVEEHRT